MGWAREEILGLRVRASEPDIYTPRGVIERLINEGQAGIAARDIPTEDVLDQVAESFGVDRSDDESFNSGEFPKVIFLFDLEDDRAVDEKGQCVRLSLEWKYES